MTPGESQVYKYCNDAKNKDGKLLSALEKKLRYKVFEFIDRI